MLQPPGEEPTVAAFTSCRRFAGQFRLYADRYEIALDAEGLELAPGQTWDLEDLTVATGPDENDLLAGLAERIAVNHPPRRFSPVPTGWCSWYCFGANVTAAQVVENTQVIKSKTPGLKYLQIDDGYERAIGDWLEVRPDFGMGLKELCGKIKAAGLEAAMWLAPFVAEEKSQVFQQHPDWFVQDEAGKPLPSARVTFGGWRNGPWYVLDGTHPQAQKYLEDVFRRMHDEWGVTYFKLDGTFWGAIHGGRHYDRSATRVEAYRRGMEAILRGAGRSFILGCNHPMWPSLGLIDGSRSSMDIEKNWDSIRRTARESFCRNWQNGRLWLNDADVLRLGSEYHAEQDLQCRASIAYATGGLLLAGDDMGKLSPERLAMLAKVVPPTGVAARFEDESFRTGTMQLPDRRVMFFFNWEETARTVTFVPPGAGVIRDFWSGAEIERSGREIQLQLAPHGARVLVVSQP